MELIFTWKTVRIAAGNVSKLVVGVSSSKLNLQRKNSLNVIKLQSNNTVSPPVYWDQITSHPNVRDVDRRLEWQQNLSCAFQNSMTALLIKRQPQKAERKTRMGIFQEPEKYFQGIFNGKNRIE